jgi:hypothetical protein
MNNLHIPFVHTYRAAFFVLFVAGFAFCFLGGVGQAPTYGWAHPISIAGYVFGITALLLGAIVLLRRFPSFIPDERSAFFGLSGIVVVKFILAALYPLFG